jgi:hypothetical protein
MPVTGVIEEVMQDCAAGFLLQLLHGVAGFDQDHVAVLICVIRLAGTNLSKPQFN